MNMILKNLMKILPGFIWNPGRDVYHYYLKKKFLIFGRPVTSGETSKARQRRLKENFFELYTNGKGLDIGYGGDPITGGVEPYDFEHGDAQYLNGISDESYDFVYSSHTLEHMDNPALALKNWYRAVKPGGYLLLYIPHRDLYEKKEKLPSQFNDNHRYFFLPAMEDLPDTIGLIPLIERTLCNFEIIYVKECSEGYKSPSPDKQCQGEYSIEAVIRKRN